MTGDAWPKTITVKQKQHSTGKRKTRCGLKELIVLLAKSEMFTRGECPNNVVAYVIIELCQWLRKDKRPREHIHGQRVLPQNVDRRTTTKRSRIAAFTYDSIVYETKKEVMHFEALKFVDGRIYRCDFDSRVSFWCSPSNDCAQMIQQIRMTEATSVSVSLWALEQMLLYKAGQ